MFTKKTELCEGEDPNATFCDFFPLKSAKILSFSLNSSKLMACFCRRMGNYMYTFKPRMQITILNPHIYYHIFNHSLFMRVKN